MAGIFALLLLAGLFLWGLWYLFYRSVLWVFEPLVEHFQDKEAERFIIEETEIEELKEEAEIINALKSRKDQMIHTICRCPKCKKETTYYDPKIKRTRCTSCDWINKIDPEMTFEEFCKAYSSIVDKTELNLKGKKNVKVTLDGLDKPIHLPKEILQKAQKEPQKLSNTNLWVYKDYIFGSRPTEEKIKELFDEET